MKVGKVLNGVVVAIAVVGFCLPEALLSAAETQVPATTDVALRDGGVLVGQVVDTNGVGIAGTEVSVRQGASAAVAAKTAADGSFSVQGLRGGVYQVATTDGHGVYRLWSAGTAPPAANSRALLVAGKDVVRGQSAASTPVKSLLTNPFVIAGVVATAVAVPVALANSHHPTSP
jgi:hypothetical protein